MQLVHWKIFKKDYLKNFAIVKISKKYKKYKILFKQKSN